jgi:cytochrome bd-type quinol oxidase subunit 2
MVVNLFLSFIRENIPLITLLITTVLAITSLFSTLINKKMLTTSSQPTLKIALNGISIYPDIVPEREQVDIGDVLNDTRYWLNII